jgi:hypothetical protein
MDQLVMQKWDAGSCGEKLEKLKIVLDICVNTNTYIRTYCHTYDVHLLSLQIGWVADIGDVTYTLLHLLSKHAPSPASLSSARVICNASLASRTILTHLLPLFAHSLSSTAAPPPIVLIVSTSAVTLRRTIASPPTM